MHIVSIFNLTLPIFIISPTSIKFSSFFFETFQALHRQGGSFILLFNPKLKIGLHIFSENGDKLICSNSVITKKLLSILFAFASFVLFWLSLYLSRRVSYE